MNCEAIDSILDDHLVARLSAVERQRAAEHVGACARCSAAWAADDVLRSEIVADPAPELFGAVLRRLASAPVRHAAARRNAWVTLGVTAAAAAIVVAIAVRWFGLELEWHGVVSERILQRSATVLLSAPQFVAGRDYEVLASAAARPAAAATDTVEVTEFFMFWCTPCYAFEPALDRWEAQAPSDVTLTRVPALFNAVAQLQARAYYTAESLGTLDAMHNAFYDEIHERGNPLASRTALEDFFLRFGVDAATFDATFDSSEVDARMERAVALNREYGITATPTLVVAGRYSTNATLGCAAAGATPDEPCRDWDSAMLRVVDQLIAESRTCGGRCPEATRER